MKEEVKTQLLIGIKEMEESIQNIESILVYQRSMIDSMKEYIKRDKEESQKNESSEDRRGLFTLNKWAELEDNYYGTLWDYVGDQYKELSFGCIRMSSMVGHFVFQLTDKIDEDKVFSLHLVPVSIDGKERYSVYTTNTLDKEHDDFVGCLTSLMKRICGFTTIDIHEVIASEMEKCQSKFKFTKYFQPYTIYFGFIMDNVDIENIVFSDKDKEAIDRGNLLSIMRTIGTNIATKDTSEGGTANLYIRHYRNTKHLVVKGSISYHPGNNLITNKEQYERDVKNYIINTLIPYLRDTEVIFLDDVAADLELTFNREFTD